MHLSCGYGRKNIQAKNSKSNPTGYEEPEHPAPTAPFNFMSPEAQPELEAGGWGELSEAVVVGGGSGAGTAPGIGPPGAQGPVFCASTSVSHWFQPTPGRGP